jgi:hypothetical protein
MVKSLLPLGCVGNDKCKDEKEKTSHVIQFKIAAGGKNPRLPGNFFVI